MMTMKLLLCIIMITNTIPYCLRLVEITARCDLDLLVSLLGRMLSDGDLEGSADGVEILLNILSDEHCCSIALLSPDNG
jgi:hypothetical protein